MLLGITLDSQSSQDLDDALWAVDEGDRVRLWIAIAAVARTVKPGSPPFQEALVWLESRYRRHQCTHPMLPPRLTEEHSLLPDKHRHVLALELAIAPSGRILESQFLMDTLISRGRIDYDRADRILLGKEESEYAPQLHLLARAASYLDTGRKGLWGHTLAQGQFRDDTGQILAGSRQLVASTAIAYNAFAAQTLAQAHAIALYRVQDITGLSDFDRIRVQVGDDPHLLAPLIAHRLPRAEHRSRVAPHWALQLPGYARSSSPLRRIEDLINQHQLLAVLNPKQPHAISKVLLDGLCERLEERAIASAAKQRERQLERQQNYIEHPTQIEALTSNQFASLLEKAAHSGEISAGVEEAIGRWLAAGKLTNRHAAVILSQPFDLQVKQQVMEAISQETPEPNAVSVLNAMEQIGGGTVTFDYRGGNTKWTCRGRWEAHVVEAMGTSKTEARANVAWELLERVIHCSQDH
ncbi:MAG: RNB domain-containing ribonuclease [Cyanobacteria bacterium J06642_2]